MDIPARVNKLLVHFGVNQKRLALMLRVSESTVKRWQKGIGVSRTDRLPAFRKLEDLMKLTEKTLSNEGIPRWYHRPAELFGRETPIEFMIKNDSGIERVTNLVGQIRWGILP
ncbi:MAG: DUF2384 domain-containing protein [Candidatus Harrisonbacteria bacterium]|nr:DUF2384 domain-containing protein [Candidatus Harrisonbacteria bacterium]